MTRRAIETVPGLGFDISPNPQDHSEGLRQLYPVNRGWDPPGQEAGMRFFLRFFRPVPQLRLPADHGTGTGPIRAAGAAADDHGSAVGEAADRYRCSISKRTARCWSSPRWEGRPAIRAGTTTSSPTPRSRYRHAPAGAGCEPSPWSGRTGIAGSSGSRPQRTDTRRTSPALIGRYWSWRCGRSRPSYSSLRRPWNSRPTQPTAPPLVLQRRVYEGGLDVSWRTARRLV